MQAHHGPLEATLSNALVLTALESAWKAIQAEHPDTPNARLVIGSGNKGGSYKYHGYYGPERWHVEEDKLPEVMIAGGRFSDGARLTFETLLHEAVHGIAATRGIQDTSRQGRWHNAKFKALAEEVGLVVEKDKAIGHRTTEITDETAVVYAKVIHDLEVAIAGAYRVRERGGTKAASERPGSKTLRCSCDRKIRMTDDDEHEMQEVHCNICGTPFLPV